MSFIADDEVYEMLYNYSAYLGGNGYGNEREEVCKTPRGNMLCVLLW